MFDLGCFPAPSADQTPHRYHSAAHCCRSQSRCSNRRDARPPRCTIGCDRCCFVESLIRAALIGCEPGWPVRRLITKANVRLWKISLLEITHYIIICRNSGLNPNLFILVFHQIHLSDCVYMETTITTIDLILMRTRFVNHRSVPVLHWASCTCWCVTRLLEAALVLRGSERAGLHRIRQRGWEQEDDLVMVPPR